MGDYRIRFGRHSGKLLTEIPANYLSWLSRLKDLREPLLTHLFDEIRRRKDGGALPGAAAFLIDREMAEALISAGLRSLSFKFHPDAGGEHDSMVRLNAAAEFLRRATR